MQRTLTIAKREFTSYFNGPAAYIVICLFLGLMGAWFWFRFFFFNRVSVRPMFDAMSFLLMFTAPALTMGLLAEEKRTGTIEVLLTMPLKDSEVVLGKFLGAFGLLLVLLGLTLPYPITADMFGKLDWGPVMTAYLAIALQGGAMLAIGLMTSSWTENQLIAFFLSVMLGVLFWWLLGFLLPFVPVEAASVLEWFWFTYHFENLLRGVVDSRDVLFYLSVIGFGLALAFRSLEKRRWS